MRLDKILVSLGVFILIITAGVFVMFGEDAEGDNFFENYGVEVNDTMFDAINQDINEVYNISKDSQGDVVGQDIDAASSWEGMILGGYKALKNFPNFFKIAGNIIMNVGAIIGIPSFFLETAMVIFSILLIFTVIYMLFRFMPRND